MEKDFAGLGPAGEALLQVGGQDMPVGYDEVREAMDAYRDEVAHELAERIRSSEKLRDYTDDHMSDCNMAADLIDPEVSE